MNATVAWPGRAVTSETNTVAHWALGETVRSGVLWVSILNGGRPTVSAEADSGGASIIRISGSSFRTAVAQKPCVVGPRIARIKRDFVYPFRSGLMSVLFARL